MKKGLNEFIFCILLLCNVPCIGQIFHGNDFQDIASSNFLSFARFDDLRGIPNGNGLANNCKDISYKHIEWLKKTTLLVVLDDPQSDLGQALMSSFNKFWKFTPLKFIKLSELESYIKDPQYSLFSFCRLKTNNDQVSPNPILKIDPADPYITDKNFDYVYMYQITLSRGNDDLITDKKYRLSSEKVAAFFSHVDVDPKPGMTLLDIQHQTIPMLDFYVMMLENYAEAIDKRLYDRKPVERKAPTSSVLYVGYKGGKEYKNEFSKYKLYDYTGMNNGAEVMKTKTIYIDSAICDSLGQSFIINLLGMDPDRVKVVNGKQLSSIIDKGEPDDVILMYSPSIGYGINDWDWADYFLFSSKGTLLIDWRIGPTAFWWTLHSEKNSQYTYRFTSEN